MKILFMGNSLTRHLPKTELGWDGDYGMAASCPENDYVHVLCRMLEEKGKHIICKAENISEIEVNPCEEVAEKIKKLNSFGADIAYIRTGQGFLYLSIIRDLYDNSIVAYKTGTEQNIHLVLNTIKAAKKKEKVTAELQLHSDQGFQYTSQAYINLTQSYGITPSMSRRRNPYDNALAENFFSILKTECIYRTKLRTYEEARILIDDYIHFYNYERIQLKTKLTPMEFRNQFVS